jgi:hypothetical protein
MARKLKTSARSKAKATHKAGTFTTKRSARVIATNSKKYASSLKRLAKQ